MVLEQINFDEKGGFDARKDMSFTMATSLTLTVLLAALDRLSLDGTPLSDIENQLLGFNLVLAIIAIAYFAIGLRQSKYELDFGVLLFKSGEKNRPEERGTRRTGPVPEI